MKQKKMTDGKAKIDLAKENWCPIKTIFIIFCNKSPTS
jgi:hypothetical protein